MVVKANDHNWKNTNLPPKCALHAELRDTFDAKPINGGIASDPTGCHLVLS